jgi:hypothetical protein
MLLTSGVVRLVAVNCNLPAEVTVDVTPAIEAELMAADNPTTVLSVDAGTATDVPLITIVLPAVRLVGDNVPVNVGQDCFHASDPNCTQALRVFL